MMGSMKRMSLVQRIVARWAQSPPPLGRWCIPTSCVYQDTCNQHVKGSHADSDNSLWNGEPLRRSRYHEEDEEERDFVVALRDRYHG